MLRPGGPGGAEAEDPGFEAAAGLVGVGLRGNPAAGG